MASPTTASASWERRNDKSATDWAVHKNSKTMAFHDRRHRVVVRYAGRTERRRPFCFPPNAPTEKWRRRNIHRSRRQRPRCYCRQQNDPRRHRRRTRHRRVIPMTKSGKFVIPSQMVAGEILLVSLKTGTTMRLVNFDRVTPRIQDGPRAKISECFAQPPKRPPTQEEDQ